MREIGELAEEALRRALPSLEVSRRLEALLERVEKRSLSAKQLHMLRTLEVLEEIATPDAREVLLALAKGAPGAWLTSEAKACLDRLAKRPPGDSKF